MGIFIFAAVGTPTGDPLTMLLVAIPMWALYEGAVVMARINDRRNSTRTTSPTTTALDDDEASAIDEASSIDDPDEVDPPSDDRLGSECPRRPSGSRLHNVALTCRARRYKRFATATTSRSMTSKSTHAKRCKVATRYW